MNMAYSTLIFFLISCFCSDLISADRYWIYFTDKGTNHQLSFKKQQEIVKKSLTKRALSRRLHRGITQNTLEIVQKDLPLAKKYLDEIENLGFQIHRKSRWLNAVSGYGNSEVLTKIGQLFFVQSVQKVKSLRFTNEKVSQEPLKNFNKHFLSDSFNIDYGSSSLQTQFHNIHELHKKGLNGKDVIIASFDTGFNLEHPALQHIKNSLIAQYDFIYNDSTTSNESADVSSQDSHGTTTLSIIAGHAPGNLVGPAYGATFILAKTEKVGEEINLEEDNWMVAAEWAEALGTDIISSSVGYSIFDPQQNSYNYSDMNGYNTIVTRAANELAMRGVIVVNSAGNEGNTEWQYITAPADGFYVIAVGALDQFNNITTFSSRGPSSDGRIKPDVSGLGYRVYGANTHGNFSYYNGTSLSCPLIAGIAAQVLQANPKLNLLQIIRILKDSGDSAQYPNNDRGWGKVNALKAWAKAMGNPSTNPTITKVHSPRPNPINRSKGLIFFPVDLPQPSPIHLFIYNILGQKIYNIKYNGTNSQNLIAWDLKNTFGQTIPVGVYLYRIKVQSRNISGKFIVVH
jgi:hypothetical protein